MLKCNQLKGNILEILSKKHWKNYENKRYYFFLLIYIGDIYKDFKSTLYFLTGFEMKLVAIGLMPTTMGFNEF